jgi:hypothetical protein
VTSVVGLAASSTPFDASSGVERVAASPGRTLESAGSIAWDASEQAVSFAKAKAQNQIHLPDER